MGYNQFIDVSDVMTHRTDIEAVEINDKISDVIEKTVEAGYSRLPVFEEELDNIKGIIYVKDLLPYVGKRVPSEVKIADLRHNSDLTRLNVVDETALNRANKYKRALDILLK